MPRHRRRTIARLLALILALAAAGLAIPSALRLAREEIALARLDSGDFAERERALETLGALRSRRAVPHIARIFRERHLQSTGIDASARAMVRIGGPAAPALVDMLAEDESSLHVTASAALERLGADAVPALLNGVRSAEGPARARMATTLLVIEAPATGAATRALREALEDDDVFVRRLAARTLEKLDLERSTAPAGKERANE